MVALMESAQHGRAPHPRGFVFREGRSFFSDLDPSRNSPAPYEPSLPPHHCNPLLTTFQSLDHTPNPTRRPDARAHDCLVLPSNFQLLLSNFCFSRLTKLPISRQPPQSIPLPASHFEN